jgi:hypothetical protein
MDSYSYYGELCCTKNVSVYCTPACNELDFTVQVNGCEVEFLVDPLPGAISYNWNFDDGYVAKGLGNIPPGTNNGTTTGTYTNPTHSYSATGFFEVCLTVRLVFGTTQQDFVCCNDVLILDFGRFAKLFRRNGIFVVECAKGNFPRSVVTAS